MRFALGILGCCTVAWAVCTAATTWWFNAVWVPRISGGD